MVSRTLVCTKQALKDAKRLSSSGLRPNTERLLKVISENPFKVPPPYEDSVGNLFHGRHDPDLDRLANVTGKAQTTGSLLTH